MQKLLRNALLLSCLSVSFATYATEENTSTDTTLPGIEVKGHRTPSYEDLTQKLAPTQSPAMAAQQNGQMGSESIINRSSNQLDLFNFSATSHRMGNTFGTSVTPQRPDPVIPKPQLTSPR